MKIECRRIFMLGRFRVLAPVLHFLVRTRSPNVFTRGSFLASEFFARTDIVNTAARGRTRTVAATVC